MNRAPKTAVEGRYRHFHPALLWLLVARLILFFAAPVTSVASQFVAITADFSCTLRVQYAGGHCETNEWKHESKSVVGTNIWCIQVNFHDHPQTENYSEITTYVFTGSYIVQHSALNANPKIGQKEWVKNRPSSGAGVGEIGQGNLSWLAFCSGPYLRRKAPVLPLPYSDAIFPQVATTATATTFNRGDW